MEVLFGPQRSGGLFISVPEEKAEEMARRLREKGIDEASVIGEIVNDPKERISVVLNG